MPRKHTSTAPPEPAPTPSPTPSPTSTPIPSPTPAPGTSRPDRVSYSCKTIIDYKATAKEFLRKHPNIKKFHADLVEANDDLVCINSLIAYMFVFYILYIYTLLNESQYSIITYFNHHMLSLTCVRTASPGQASMGVIELRR